MRLDLPGVLLVLLMVFSCAVICITAVGATGGIEYNIVSLVVPLELQGSFQTIVVPFNVSDIGLISESNTYVLVQGQPRIGYLFSRNPPVMAWVEASTYSGIYEIWYGGGNPYSQYIGAPGSSYSIWLVFDDFDYSTGFWSSSSVSITGSRAFISPNGYMVLTTPYSTKTEHLWLIHGRRAYVLFFDEPINSFVYLRLDPSNFADIGNVIDGSDVYFIDGNSACLFYSIINFQEDLLEVSVNPQGNTIIYMLYGGENICQNYRVME